MKRYLCIVGFLCLISCENSNAISDLSTENKESNYLQNRAPLLQKPYLELPLTSIQARGWLKDQLLTMANGLTGHLDSIYPQVVGERNGWLGGDGDGWERGPYWIDGLLPLAYILNDSVLIKKTTPWIEWTLNNQLANGYIGPIPFKNKPEYEKGLQRGNREDWWPKMVMLKILKQYYGATKDPRVIKTLSNYFKYQLTELNERPLDAATFWAGRRGADNLQVVYWLYSLTGEAFLLDLGDLIDKQTFPWTEVFLNNQKPKDSVVPYQFFKMKSFPYDSLEIKNTSLAQIGSIHTVNLAQGLKQPIIRYQKDPDEKYLKATKKAIEDIERYHGQPQGMYSGDEPLHGTSPVQGIEFCSISEKMFSLESILQITGDTQYADLLEKITFNALPTQASDDFTARQYFQAANQVQLTDQLKESFETKNHKGTDFVFGVLTGYPCCTTNMHQSWPKFVQNLFYATPDKGVAALLYAPSKVSLKVGQDTQLTLEESTTYPFNEDISFEFQVSKPTSFPFHLRIPKWTHKASIIINGENTPFSINNGIAVINREWKTGDKLVLKLPMNIKKKKWAQETISLERGPLVFALKINEDKRLKNRNDGYGTFTEIYPKDKWNYGLIDMDSAALNKNIKVVFNQWEGNYPWNLENTPISLKLKAVSIPEWKLIDGAPIIPDNLNNSLNENLTTEEIILVPYGCTTLRITEFPTMSSSH